MNICSLRAMTLSNDPYVFTVADIPVVVSEDTFVLLRRRFSPILRLNTLSMGSDVGVFEGDILEDVDGSRWYVGYESGFVAYSMGRGKRRFLYDFVELKVVSRMTADEFQAFKFKKTKIKFKYQDYIFIVNDIVGKYRDDLLTQNIRGRVRVSELQQALSIVIDGKRMYLGDLYRGYPVIMCFGRICIQNEFGIYDVLERSYLQKRMKGDFLYESEGD